MNKQLGVTIFGAVVVMTGLAGRSEAATITFNAGVGVTDPGFTTWDEAGIHMQVTAPRTHGWHDGQDVDMMQNFNSELVFSAGGASFTLTSLNIAYNNSGFSFSNGTPIHAIDVAGVYSSNGTTTHVIFTPGVYNVAHGVYSFGPGFTGTQFVWQTNFLEGIDSIEFELDSGGGGGGGGPSEASAVPEPGTMILLGSGLVGLVARRRMKKSAA